MKLRILRTIIVNGQVKYPGDVVDVNDLTKNLLVGQNDAEVIAPPAPAKAETATAKPDEKAVEPKAGKADEVKPEGKQKG